MLEYHFSKTYPGDSKDKAKHGPGWADHVIMTRVFESEQERDTQWARAGNAPMEHDADFKPECLPRVTGVTPMYITPSLFDLLYELDGFTQYDCRTVKGVGRLVYVQKGEELPFYVHQDLNANPSSACVSRHHYLMLIGPGGFVCCVAMKTGTKLWSGKPLFKVTDGKCIDDELQHLVEMDLPEGFKFWFDLIPELLKDSEVPRLEGRPANAPHSAKIVRDKIASTTWEVCLEPDDGP